MVVEVVVAPGAGGTNDDDACFVASSYMPTFVKAASCKLSNSSMPTWCLNAGTANKAAAIKTLPLPLPTSRKVDVPLLVLRVVLTVVSR